MRLYQSNFDRSPLNECLTHTGKNESHCVELFWWIFVGKVPIFDYDNPTFFQMILDAVEQVGGIYVVTADHGNAEDMVKRNKSGRPLLDKNGNIQILTSHTVHPVCILTCLNFILPCIVSRDHDHLNE